MEKLFYVLCILVLTLFSCKPKDQNASDTGQTTETSTSGGEWMDMLEGNTLNRWKGWKKDQPGAAWTVTDGVLTFDTLSTDRGDLLTRSVFQNFELMLDWKISKCGNSGIMYNVQEGAEYNQTYETGPEMQILDNACHEDSKIKKHRAGDLYDLIEGSEDNSNPAGEWNSMKIRSNNGEVEFWQNNQSVVKFTMYGETWAKMIADSKFKDWKGFGAFKNGHIALQDHGNPVSSETLKSKHYNNQHITYGKQDFGD